MVIESSQDGKHSGVARAQRNGSGVKPALHEESKLKSRQKRSLSFFFYQLFAVGGFVGGDYFFGQFIGDYVVVGKFHGVAGAGLRHGREVGGVGEHFGQRDLGFDDYTVATNFTTSDASAPRTQVAEQITGILIW